MSALDVVIDCDPGIDDALALFVAAASPERLRLLGVSCVAGNRPVETTTANACRVLGAAGRTDVPVHAGAAQPLAPHPARCNLVHGEDGLGGVAIDAPPAAQAELAASFLLRTLGDGPAGSVTVVALGPLTNLALAERARPGLLRRARSVVVMGGAVTCPGNVTPRAEFNFHADSVAAQVVLAAGAEVELFGLDVTSKAVMSAAWIDSLAALDGRCAALAHRMLRAYATQDALLHDACPLAWLLRPALFASQSWRLDVDASPGDSQGQVRGEPIAGSIALARGAARVHTQVDTAGLLALVAQCLARLP
ncbi:MAG TPA: nucleoside hydrolase [Methylibium sp.]|uniref:nucleoside hydrolase n=1 Tax=Methylibium sp. TaxID=2067992 RepID=UPI002DBBCB16|nr:nucleoside hydrolase [Methylibium sp.]HEU4460270.1 nucleoside hydrolase [Methylibium sp.]